LCGGGQGPAFGAPAGRVRGESRDPTDHTIDTKGTPMSGEKDQIQGRVKQAAGELIDDDELHREGERDEAAGKLKEKAGEVKEHVEDAIDAVKDRMNKD
jgi:uncharacterized protein YjbJ (UPF0337 family)